MAFGREKLDVYRAAGEGMPCMRKRMNTEPEESTPIPTPTPTPTETRRKKAANNRMQRTARTPWLMRSVKWK